MRSKQGGNRRKKFGMRTKRTVSRIAQLARPGTRAELREYVLEVARVWCLFGGYRSIRGLSSTARRMARSVLAETQYSQS